jgi:hypothetical protein
MSGWNDIGYVGLLKVFLISISIILMIIVFIVQSKLRIYLKNNNKEVYERIMRKDLNWLPFEFQRYSQYAYTRYLFDDSKDDAQSLFYKKIYKFGLLFSITSFLIFMVIF